MAECGRMVGIALVGMALAAGARAEPPAVRQDELLYRLRHDCGSCHGMTLKGGLGPPLLPDTLATRSENDLASVILDGVPGTPMPPWDFEITTDEARWLARQLKQGLDDAG
jgi:cytochrome c55X